MNKNKILYRSRTAVTYTLTLENLITLCLGAFTSVKVTMLYLQENLRQQTLASIFKTSQATISRAINNVLNVLVVVLSSPPQPVRASGPDGYTC